MKTFSNIISPKATVLLASHHHNHHHQQESTDYISVGGQTSSSSKNQSFNFTNNYFITSSNVELASLGLKILLIISTILLNCLIIYIILFSIKKKTFSNFLFLSAAVADLFIGIFSQPFMAIYSAYDRWPFGYRLCIYWLITDYSSYSVSILSLLFISLHRYKQIKSPLIKEKLTRPRLLLIFLIWFCSYAFWFGVVWPINENNYMNFDCEIIYSFTLTMLTELFTLIFPILLICVINFRIFIALRSKMHGQVQHRHSRRCRNSSAKHASNHNHNNNKTVQTNDSKLLKSQPSLEPIEANENIKENGDDDATKVDEKNLRQSSLNLIRDESVLMINGSEMDFDASFAFEQQLKQQRFAEFGLRKKKNRRSSLSDSFSRRFNLKNNNICNTNSKKTIGRSSLPAQQHSSTVELNELQELPPQEMARSHQDVNNQHGHRLIIKNDDLQAENLRKNGFLRSQLVKNYNSYKKQRDRKAFMCLLMISSTLILSWLAFLILWPIKAYCFDCVDELVFNISTWIIYSSSASNAILLLIFHDNFQKEFFNILKNNNSRSKCYFNRRSQSKPDNNHYNINHRPSLPPPPLLPPTTTLPSINLPVNF